jgi:hypothetical protein
MTNYNLLIAECEIQTLTLAYALPYCNIITGIGKSVPPSVKHGNSLPGSPT